MDPYSNGAAPAKGHIAILQKKLAEYEAKASGIRTALEELGVHAQASADRRASQTFRGALRQDTKRRQAFHWSTKEEQAQRRDAVRSFVREHPLCLNREVVDALTAQGFVVSTSRLSQILTEMPDIERVGTMSQSRYRLRTTAKTSTQPKMRANEPGSKRWMPPPGYFTKKEEAK